jgi:hypothetical protein
VSVESVSDAQALHKHRLTDRDEITTWKIAEYVSADLSASPIERFPVPPCIQVFLFSTVMKLPNFLFASALVVTVSASSVTVLGPGNFDSIIGKGKPGLVELSASLFSCHACVLTGILHYR